MNTIIKCGTWQPVKAVLNWIKTEWFFLNRISELMLPALIQKCNKNHFIFDPIQEKWLKFYGHFMIMLIPYVNLLNLSSIKNKKKSIFEE